MNSSEKGGMFDLILNESMGGNAGSWNGHSCVATNFLYNPYSGKIVYFGNKQDIPDEIRDVNFPKGVYRLAVRDISPTYRVISIHAEGARKETGEILVESARRFNEHNGFTHSDTSIGEHFERITYSH